MAKDELIVLTGGAGFIGSCFLSKLNQGNITRVIVVDEFDSNLKHRNIATKKLLDCVDKDKFVEAVRSAKYPAKVQAIFHLGACSSTLETRQDYLWQNNYEYSKTLAQWALRDNIPFFYASSAATYGDGSLGYSDLDQVSLTLKPLNLYGQSKQLFDLWLINNNLANQVVGWKYFNVFGPNEYHKGELRSLVVKAYEQIKKDQKIRLFKSYQPEYKDGEQKRDFIYVKDAVELMWQFYQNPQLKGIYNVGTGQAKTWNDLAAAIFKALNLPVNIEYLDMPEYLKDQYQYFTQADLVKLKATTLPVGFTSLEQAVADYVNNYLEKGLACL